jgi:hypothetical protein
MITYFKAIQQEEQNKLQAIQSKYGACQEIEVKSEYRPLRIKKIPMADSWMSPTSHKNNFQSPY